MQEVELPAFPEAHPGGSFSPLSQGLHFSQAAPAPGAGGRPADSPGKLADAAEKGLGGLSPEGGASAATRDGGTAVRDGGAAGTLGPAAARLAALNISIAGLVPGLNIEVGCGAVRLLSLAWDGPGQDRQRVGHGARTRQPMACAVARLVAHAACRARPAPGLTPGCDLHRWRLGKPGCLAR